MNASREGVCSASGHPSRRTKRPYAGTHLSRPWLAAGSCRACREILRLFRAPAAKPHGVTRSAKSGRESGAFRGVWAGQRREAAATAGIVSRFSCGFTEGWSFGKVRRSHCLRPAMPASVPLWVIPAGSAKTLPENPQVTDERFLDGVPRCSQYLVLRQAIRLSFGLNVSLGDFSPMTPQKTDSVEEG